MKSKATSRRLANFALCIVNCALISSCRTDELCYDHPHGASINVAFNWASAPDARPEGMRLWLYPQGGRSLEAELRDLPGFEGGKVKGLVEGRYHVISHNNDTELVTYHDRETHGSHRASTRDADILEPMSRAGDVSSKGLRGEADERVAASPDRLWLANSLDADVKDGATVTLSPSQVHCRYTYEFLNVGPTGGISKVSASISGMSAGVWLADGTHIGETVTHPLEAWIDAPNQRIYGDFFTFGYPADSPAPHRMALYVIMADGQKYKYTEGDYLDVTEQVRSAPDPQNVHIVIDGLELPTPVSGGGFDPSVSDWDEVHHDIDI